MRNKQENKNWRSCNHWNKCANWWTIADNVIIGANAVVIHDVPSNCSVGGVPAKILKDNIDVTEYCSLGKY